MKNGEEREEETATVQYRGPLAIARNITSIAAPTSRK
jgi:hypothetical protein